MAVTHPTIVRNGLADYVVDQLDEGTPPGNLVFRTASDVVVATLAFSFPAFGDAVGGVATAGTITADPAAVGGIIAKATLENAAGAVKVTCSVTAIGGGGDIELTTVNVAGGKEVSMSSLTYEAAP